MRLSSNVFLIAYAIFLVFGVLFVIKSPDNAAINNLICAISVASGAIALADLFCSKVSIDKEERKQLLICYISIKRKSDFYLSQMVQEYGQKANEIVLALGTIFNDEEIMLLLSNSIPSEERKIYLKRIEEGMDNKEQAEEITEFLTTQSDATDDVADIIDDQDEKPNIVQLTRAGLKKEKRNLIVANVITIIGLSAFLIILAWDNICPKYVSTINNVLTITAFLAVILNLILKDNYRAKSLRELENMKKEVYKL